MSEQDMNLLTEGVQPSLPSDVNLHAKQDGVQPLLPSSVNHLREGVSLLVQGERQAPSEKRQTSGTR